MNTIILALVGFVLGFSACYVLWQDSDKQYEEEIKDLKRNQWKKE